MVQTADINKVEYPRQTEVRGENEKAYKVTRFIDSGAFASVHCVTDGSNEYILKTFLKEADEAKERAILSQVNRVLNEAGLGDNVVPFETGIVPFIHENKKWYGHIEGMAPGQDIRIYKPDEKGLLLLAIKFARVLQACCKSNIAYQDIQPLRHVFWEAGDLLKVTVIDWNKASLNATYDQMRSDLWAFCARLPEFFTGSDQDKSDDKLYALDWAKENQSDRKGRSLSYAVWQALAVLSLDPTGPILPEVYRAFAIPTDYNNQKEIIAAREENNPAVLLSAWEKIISLLENVYESLQPGANANTLLPFFDEMRQHAEARKLADEELLVRAIKTRRWDRVNDSEGLAMVISARLLRPGDFTISAANSIYAFWNRYGHIGSPFPGLMKALLEENFVLVREESKKISTEWLSSNTNYIPADKILFEEGHKAQKALLRELAFWTAYVEAVSQADLEAKKGILENALKNGNHPKIKLELNQVSIKLTSHNEIQDKVRALDEAYNNLDHELMEQILAELDGVTDDVKIVDKVKMYQKRVNVIQEIEASLDSWESTDTGLIDLAALPGGEELYINIKNRFSQHQDEIKRVKAVEFVLNSALIETDPKMRLLGLGRVKATILDIHKTYGDSVRKAPYYEPLHKNIIELAVSCIDRLSTNDVALLDDTKGQLAAMKNTLVGFPWLSSEEATHLGEELDRKGAAIQAAQETAEAKYRAITDPNRMVKEFEKLPSSMQVSLTAFISQRISDFLKNLNFRAAETLLVLLPASSENDSERAGFEKEIHRLKQDNADRHELQNLLNNKDPENWLQIAEEAAGRLSARVPADPENKMLLSQLKDRIESVERNQKDSVTLAYVSEKLDLIAKTKPDSGDQKKFRLYTIALAVLLLVSVLGIVLAGANLSRNAQLEQGIVDLKTQVAQIQNVPAVDNPTPLPPNETAIPAETETAPTEVPVVVVEPSATPEQDPTATVEATLPEPTQTALPGPSATAVYTALNVYSCLTVRDGAVLYDKASRDANPQTGDLIKFSIERDPEIPDDAYKPEILIMEKLNENEYKVRFRFLVIVMGTGAQKSVFVYKDTGYETLKANQITINTSISVRDTKRTTEKETLVGGTEVENFPTKLGTTEGLVPATIITGPITNATFQISGQPATYYIVEVNATVSTADILGGFSCPKEAY